MSDLLTFWWSHATEAGRLLGEHIVLVVVATVVATLLGVPIGILAARRPRVGGPVSAAASVVQTIPSLALFGFLLPLPLVGGIGARTAVVALVLYGLLPIVRTTISGLRNIDPAVLEAADAMGMTSGQRLVRVELPLARPAMMAGVRVAAVFGVGTATIAAAIGAGGLGEYIYRGLSMVDATVILAGAVPVAALALLMDGLLLAAERAWATRARRPLRVPILILVLGLLGTAVVVAGRSPGERIVVGSKNFTEQVLLGELVAQAIERYAGLPVDKRLNLGGTLICDQALRAGDIDVYVEYSGTALTAVFGKPIQREAGAVLAAVRDAYARTGRTWLAPLGFNNSFAILVRGTDARARGLRTLSQLAAHAPLWRVAVGYEFLERPDGFAGLVSTYGLRFAADPRVMDLALIYRALAGRQADIVAGDATAGLIEALDLVALEDDRGYFPPYEAAPVVSTATLLRHPSLGEALHRLDGRLSVADMRRMNHAVDGRRADPATVVREFLDALDSGV